MSDLLDHPTTLSWSRMLHGVRALGPGRRLVVWLQGCTIGCAGCVSRDTWDPSGGTTSTLDEVVEFIRALVDDDPDPAFDGITVTGGEPFEQASALALLLPAVRIWADARNRQLGLGPIDILCYSGRTLDRLAARHEDVLAQIDTLIDGPFIERLPTSAPLRGSANQRVLPLTALGRERLGHLVDPDASDLDAVPMQLHVGEGSVVHFVGIPRRGDLDRLTARAAARGVRLEDLSWQP